MVIPLCFSVVMSYCSVRFHMRIYSHQPRKITHIGLGWQGSDNVDMSLAPWYYQNKVGGMIFVQDILDSQIYLAHRFNIKKIEIPTIKWQMAQQRVATNQQYLVTLILHSLKNGDKEFCHKLLLLESARNKPLYTW